MHMFDVHMQVLKMLDEFNNREEDVSVSHRHELWMLMESVEEGCHFNGTPNYRDCEEDIPMHLALPLLGVDNGKAVSESNLDHSRTDLCCGHEEGYLANRW